MNHKKIKTREEMGEIVKTFRKENPLSKIVTTNGAFDIMHVGHVYSLEKAKSYGDILIVGLNSDSSIKKYKSPDRPIIPQQYRAEMLASLNIVDYVVIFDETDPRELLKVIKPDFHVKSKSSFKSPELEFKDGVERETVEALGGKVILIEDIPSISTSQIIKKILEVENKNLK